MGNGHKVSEQLTDGALGGSRVTGESPALPYTAGTSLPTPTHHGLWPSVSFASGVWGAT